MTLLHEIRVSYVLSTSSLVSVEPVEVPRYDWNRDGESQHPADGTRCPDQLSSRAQRNLVSVSDRRHRYDGPPESVWNRVDRRPSLVEFSVLDGGREDEQADDKGDEEQTETLEACPERQQQDLKTWKKVQ